jgi:predicted transcriptional regulator
MQQLVLPCAEMTTLTLKVPDELAQKLAAVSARKRVSKSKIVREALIVVLRREKARPSLYDRMKNGLGCIDSGSKDLATNPKHLQGMGQWRR